MAGYYVLRLLSWLICLLPLRAVYFFSDVIFVIMYHLLRYRRDVVDLNLMNSFPEKNKMERDRIARRYYHHLCDCFLETLNFDTISNEKARSRVTYHNAGMANNYLQKGRQVIILMGHYNNWECFNTWGLHSPFKSYPVYKKLRSPVFEKFFIHLRSRFGSEPLERSLTYRVLYEDSKAAIPSVSLFLIDQTPRVHDIQHWMTFLNQETAVLVGPEKVAARINAVVLFGKTRKVKRGYYDVELILVTDEAKSSPKYEITEKSNLLLEQAIIENPEFWLWSHRKWKHKRSESVSKRKIMTPEMAEL